jgi:hypothetical protein
MADFLVLPPRNVIGEQVAKLIRPYLPGVCVTAGDCLRFLETLTQANRQETILIHHDELPMGSDLDEALRDGFGADEMDRIVHVSLDARTAPLGLGLPTIASSFTTSTR